MIIRRMSNLAAGLAYRIYPDGREELVRNATVHGANAASFKDILAVSNTRTVYTAAFTPPAGPLPNFTGFFSAPTLVSYVVSSLLFEDMTVEQPAANHRSRRSFRIPSSQTENGGSPMGSAVN